jgi:hypothetical protein
MPNNDMDKPENITNKTFEAASEAMGLSAKESKRNALELLEKVLASEEESGSRKETGVIGKFQ